MANADFITIVVNEHVGNTQNVFLDDPIINSTGEAFPFTGGHSSMKTFQVEGTPIGDGYILMQVYSVHTFRNQIIVNNQELPSMDIPVTGNAGWVLWNDRIPQSFLRPGLNTLRFRSRDGDDFLIRWVTVHWREQ